MWHIWTQNQGQIEQPTFGRSRYTYEGIPTTMALRQILQFATNLADAESQVKEAARTNSIFVGVGSKEDGEFVAMVRQVCPATCPITPPIPRHVHASVSNRLFHLQKCMNMYPYLYPHLRECFKSSLRIDGLAK
jgi:hypothetical protein